MNNNKEGIKFDEKSINRYAVNGALNYARFVVSGEDYHEAIAIGISGDNAKNIQVSVYYVYGYSEIAFKEIENVVALDFLENEETFNVFLKDARLTPKDKHRILIDSRGKLSRYANRSNETSHKMRDLKF